MHRKRIFSFKCFPFLLVRLGKMSTFCSFPVFLFDMLGEHLVPAFVRVGKGSQIRFK